MHTIIDVGAGLKSMYSRFTKHYPDARVYAIEPHPILAKKLRDEFAGNNAVIVCECVINDGRKEKVDLYCTRDASTSSTLPIRYENARRWKNPPGRRWIAPDQPPRQSVPAESLDSFIAKHNLRHIDFINIDVQGCAMEVLKSMKSTRSWDNLKEIRVKVHTIDFEMYRGQSQNYEVLHFLKRKYMNLVDIRHISQDQEDVLTFQNALAELKHWKFMDWNKIMQRL